MKEKLIELKKLLLIYQANKKLDESVNNQFYSYEKSKQKVKTLYR